MIRVLGLTLLAVAAVACAQLGQLVNYTIDEQELERLAYQQIRAQDYSIRLPGASAALEVNELGLQIDKDGDGKVHLFTDSVINTSLLGRSYPVGAKVTISGVPSYSLEHHAIFIREVRLEGSSIDMAGASFNISGIADEVYDFLNDWLDENPVYRFDRDDSRYQLLQQLGLELAVEPGQLRIKSAG